MGDMQELLPARGRQAVSMELRHFCREAEQYFVAHLRGRRQEATRRLRRLRRDVRRRATAPGAPAQFWLLLADLYVTRRPRVYCLRRALARAPRDPEANAELALELAGVEAQSVTAKRCVTATRRLRRHPLEEELLYTIYLAYKRARLEERATRTLSVGQRRYPRSALFRPAKSPT